MPRLSLVLLIASAALAGCERGGPRQATGAIGDPQVGARLVVRYGCGECHQIPGVREARGRVGPPLDHMGERTVIAGLLPNTPGNMIRWLMAPQSVVPGNAMPDMEVSEDDARNMAAYLDTLR